MPLSPEAKERKKLLDVRLNMISRCYDTKNAQYMDYGGRGITVCERWLASPRAFIADMWPRPAGMTLDRIDNDKGYSPDNVRWASRAEQQRNRRNNIHLEVSGTRVILKDAAEAAGLRPDCVWKRIQRGWSHEDALSTPATRANRGQPRGQVTKQTHLMKEEA